MSTIDTSVLVGYTVQLSSLQAQASAATDPTVKAFLNSQIAMVTAQLSAEAQHQQAQADASSNLMSGLGIMSTFTAAVGNAAPSLIALLKP
jgi:hypothetical protein